MSRRFLLAAVTLVLSARGGSPASGSTSGAMRNAMRAYGTLVVVLGVLAGTVYVAASRILASDLVRSTLQQVGWRKAYT